ncbi:MAG: aminotransferase class I/II-fold pyridoxal phosphate-dependent enzyme [Oscillospiraceae bacterium]|nr:aminotransferase class I/II-fold pyridoxal phosphate-dependent enzyme [Oscillospiraceae bacterium]
MKYDFTSILDRSGRDALAVDGLGTIPGFSPDKPKDGFDVIPMWVADQNFPVCPSITKAVIERARHPSFGYFAPRDEYYDSIIRWQETRNHAAGLSREHIGHENGVLGGVITALNVLCSKGDSVLLHSPTYIGFTVSLEGNGYHIVHSPLSRDGNGVWRMDFDDMEKKLSEHRIHAAIFCSPHNPCGRVWERWEVERAMELFRKYDVYVISDEIWSDILLNGSKHTPTQSVSEDARQRTVALYAPSKTFNLAGLVGSYHIIYNARIRDRVDREASLSHYNAMNVLSMHALIGAYSPEGQQWADELCETISGNVNFACDYIRSHFEGVDAAKPEGTYMLFPDCAGWLEKHGKTLEQLEKAGWDVGVAWQDGSKFHGATHLRLNLALPLSRVREAFGRMDRYVFNT